MSYSSQTHAIISFVEAHVRAEKFDYQELERQIGFSLAHIRDLFKKNTQCSLAKYVRIRKIINSAFELVHSDRSIMDIALQYGFANHESYTRAFARIVGVTPSEFRRVRLAVGRNELITGVYGIGLVGERTEAMDMIKEQYRSNESTILYGVPKVKYGAYGGNTPYPICVKACADYLGEDVSYAYLTTAIGAAFRLTWNKDEWDLGNVDVWQTYEGSDEVYELGAKALGRSFEILGRNENTKKEDFIKFIKEHVDAGYPCIALGIIGPPEACLITGYRDNGNTLLGWNFFQNDPDFAKDVKKDDSGYFICDDWWENSDTHAVMCIGDKVNEPITQKEILKNAVRAMTGRVDGCYCKGVAAYDAWADMLGDNNNFSEGDNFSVLFHKMLCQNDATTCLVDGRGCAAEYFKALDDGNIVQKDKVNELAQIFVEAKSVVSKMPKLLGSWDDMDKMLANLADSEVREKLCEYIKQAKELDEKALLILKSL